MEDLDAFAVRASESTAGAALDRLRAAWMATHPEA
jgi:hypothetical protein